MTVLKGLMQVQTRDIKGTIVEQGRRLENVAKVLHESRNDNEKRFVTIDTKLERMR